MGLIAGLAFVVFLAVMKRPSSNVVVDARDAAQVTPGQPLTEDQLIELFKRHQNESSLIKELRAAQTVSVEQRWSKSDWISRFGEPSVLQERDDGDLLYYFESDDYFVAKSEYMHGLKVWLEEDITALCEAITMHSN